MENKQQRGFHLVSVILLLFSFGVVAAIAVKVLSVNKNKDEASPAATKGGEVEWAFNEKDLKWYTKSGTPPPCADSFVFEQTPVDLSKIMVIGMPGAYRGYNYKPHGGMRLIDPDSGKIEVRMPTDATLVGLRRYYEGEPQTLQYLLTFETDCGIAFRFDHLYMLTDAFQAIAETTPEPKLNDTRSNPNEKFSRTKFKAGDLIATEVGFPAIKNFGFDFGMYDYRSRNEISKDAAWAKIHSQYQSLEWYGRCWVDRLPAADVPRAKELALTFINPAKPNIVSDYCGFAPHKTLEFNSGQPTDG